MRSVRIAFAPHFVASIISARLLTVQTQMSLLAALHSLLNASPSLPTKQEKFIEKDPHASQK